MSAACCDHHIYVAADQIGGVCGQSIGVPIRPPIFDRDVLALNKSDLIQAALERGNEMRETGSSLGVQKPDDGHRRLLRLRRNRPNRRAADKRDELAPVH
jgi:hypothetical protein